MQNKKEEIEEKIKSKDAFVFIKGTPSFPMCGFSAKVIEALNVNGVEFGYSNILEEEELFEELKKYTNWPTSPQVFIKGEFVGGCDTTLEMLESGELAKLLL